MAAPAKKFVDPTELYLEKFFKNIAKAEKKGIKSKYPGLGAARKDCNKYDVEHAHRLISEAKLEGKRRFKRREREENFRDDVWVIWQQNRNLYQFDLNKRKLQRYARNIGQNIYDLPATWTGYRTVDSIDTNQKVPEHFYPRQWAGRVVVNYILEHDGIEFDVLYDLLKVLSQVHFTTKEENQKLRKLQDSETFIDWHEPYVELCSELVHEKDLGPVKEIGDILSDPHKYYC